MSKLIYRSKQRGFLELDLMVGLWAERQVPKMSRPMLNSFSDILDCVSGPTWPAVSVWSLSWPLALNGLQLSQLRR